ncbi:hypothetical protein FO519_000867 [Halicephalobus sp. NKZ332]|nr:hypothetical protein FO519_000867 [Halicephalobus sp. NKZ332]
MIWRIIVFASLSGVIGAENSGDLVVDLPGVLFQTNFSTYSGVLYANVEQTWKMQYLLFESKSDPSTDPLIVWYSGGPGCSGISEVFQEHAPFYVTGDGGSLFENVFGWNAKANFLIVDSPIGVGFSFDSNNMSYSEADDSQTAQQNYVALKDFFNRAQTKYKGREFFIAGVSFAGVYIPMLSAIIAEDDSFPAQFKGLAIGDGLIHVEMLNNALILWSFYHGRISLKDWETLKSKECCDPNPDSDSCDWSKFLITRNGFDFEGDNTTCGKILQPIMQAPEHVNAMNYYHACYDNSEFKGSQDRTITLSSRGNPAEQFNRDSTDSLNGYSCWSGGPTYVYLNNVAVQKALNVDQQFLDAKKEMGNCNGDVYEQYVFSNPDMRPYFERIVAKVSNFHILIYNGDAICNFLGCAKFIDSIAKPLSFSDPEARERWYFRGALAGFYQRYRNEQKNISMDVTTINGGGHLSPIDRPGPTFLMINNFIRDISCNYSNTDELDVNPQLSPLLESVQTTTGTSEESNSPQTTTETSGKSNSPQTTTTTSKGAQEYCNLLFEVLIMKSRVKLKFNLEERPGGHARFLVGNLALYCGESSRRLTPDTLVPDKPTSTLVFCRFLLLHFLPFIDSKMTEPPPEYSEAIRTGISLGANPSQCEANMIPLLSQAVLDQSATIVKLEKQIELQNDEIKLLKAKVDDLQIFHGERRRNVALELFCALIIFFFVVAFIRLFRTR